VVTGVTSSRRLWYPAWRSARRPSARPTLRSGPELRLDCLKRTNACLRTKAGLDSASRTTPALCSVNIGCKESHRQPERDRVRLTSGNAVASDDAFIIAALKAFVPPPALFPIFRASRQMLIFHQQLLRTEGWLLTLGVLRDGSNS
jgi:hypothetical protein